MAEDKIYRPFGWIIIMVLSIIFLIPTLLMLFLSGGVDILVSGLSLAESSLDITDLDKAALGFLNMSMLKPLWEEVWIGVLGIYAAFGLKQGKTHAWGIGLGWGIMILEFGRALRFPAAPAVSSTAPIEAHCPTQ